MSDIKLFRTNGSVEELSGTSVALEKSLQTLFEQNLESLLGVRFLASEHTTGAVHGGRIDTLGIDENNCPVILEYKRATNENVINQGLYYLDWLLDHRADFQLLVQKALGTTVAEEIDWSSPRLICIAGDYTKFDQHAVQQINRHIELFRYKRYGDELLLLELVNVPNDSKSVAVPDEKMPSDAKPSGYKTFETYLNQADTGMQDLYQGFRDYMLALGDDIHTNRLNLYEAYKRIKNVASIVIQPQKKDFLVYIYDPGTVDYSALSNVKNVGKSGHWGTGDLEIRLSSIEDLKQVEPLLLQAYERS
ncbi:DUF5655 domain-containing protein [Alicyclobacillus sp. SO9]|uniref:DUF5655 domain-containing protein n=1 Tax=Alicyclobacillus sp. SO9 TaxID=2665646 RepID=UPI0018E735F7|nr:DUF5655 domain-containing protein [Alicyclobacillus sp. SO9]QQE80431.1 DUF91 domain-containing protein [Alicyclobacillus sp. SO9]